VLGKGGQQPERLGLDRSREGPDQNQAQDPKRDGGREARHLAGDDRIVAPGANPTVAPRSRVPVPALQGGRMLQAPDGEPAAQEADPQEGPGKSPPQRRDQGGAFRIQGRSDPCADKRCGWHEESQGHGQRGRTGTLAAPAEEDHGLGRVGADREDDPDQGQPDGNQQGRVERVPQEGPPCSGQGTCQWRPQQQDQAHGHANPEQGTQTEAGQRVHDPAGLQAGSQDLLQTTPSAQGDQDGQVHPEVVPGQGHQHAQPHPEDETGRRRLAAQHEEDPCGQAIHRQGQAQPEGRGTPSGALSTGCQQGRDRVGLARFQTHGHLIQDPGSPLQGKQGNLAQALGRRDQAVQPASQATGQLLRTHVPGPLRAFFHQLAGARCEARGKLGHGHRGSRSGQAAQGVANLPAGRAPLQVSLDLLGFFTGRLSIDPGGERLEEAFALIGHFEGLHREPSRPFPVRAWTKRCRALARRLRTVPRGICNPWAISS